jgi:lipopolysaccharide/colanic/teichoic acid biosynthesis glycosyltransferase
MSRALAKRSLDIAGSVLGVLLLSPLFVVITLLVRWRMGRPALFLQQRAGFGGMPFRLLKFRTMQHAADPADALATDATRVTPLGQRLRAWSLDELPELFNVIRGDMSLVGPRPLLMEYLPLYTPEQARRHEVKPGITGWAQVNGRNALTWEEKFALDVWYVDHRSFRLDLKILARTVLQVPRREGISAEGHATMPPFRGSGERPS